MPVLVRQARKRLVDRRAHILAWLLDNVVGVLCHAATACDAHMLDEDVVRDGEEPGAIPTTILVARQRLQNTDECVVHQIASQVAATRCSAEVGVQRGPVVRDQGRGRAIRRMRGVHTLYNGAQRESSQATYEFVHFRQSHRDSASHRGHRAVARRDTSTRQAGSLEARGAARQRDVRFRRDVRGVFVAGQMPRVFELKELTDSRLFEDFEESLTSNPLKLDAFFRLEQGLSVLDAGTWNDLKDRAVACAHRWEPGRGWQQLFDTLNEAKGYACLQRIGCERIRFVPRSSGLTPDLEGYLDDRVLCEVKTINVSQEEARHRARVQQGTIEVTSPAFRLADGFLAKLSAVLSRASQQLMSYDVTAQARRIILVVLHFDDWIGDYEQEYVAQIDEHLLANPVTRAEVFICRPRNVFERQFKMRAATIVDI